MVVLWFVLFAPVMSSMFAEFGRFPTRPMTPAEIEAFTARQMAAMQPLYTLSGIVQLFSAAYSIGFWAWRGQTPGKMLLGLRIVRETDGSRPGLGRAVLRYVGYMVSSIVLLIGFIWVAFDPRKQGWHDKIAGTVVIQRVS